MFFYKNIFLIAVILLLGGCFLKETRSPMSDTRYRTSAEAVKTVKINGREITVEIADTPEKQYQGLSFRKNLCADCGMLFVFSDKKERTFVMRNMNFPLDIIFIDGNKIVKINKNLPPESAEPKELYNSGQPVNRVLEVNGGFADRCNIKEGNEVSY